MIAKRISKPKASARPLPELSAQVALELERINKRRGYRGVAVVIDPVGEMLIVESHDGGWRLLAKSSLPRGRPAPITISRLERLKLKPGMSEAEIGQAVVAELSLIALDESGELRH